MNADIKPEESTVSVNETLWASNGPGETLSMNTFEQALEMMGGLAQPTSYFGRTMAEGNRNTIVLHPAFESQLAEAGFTKQYIVQWLYDKLAEKSTSVRLRVACICRLSWQRCQFHLQENAGYYVPGIAMRPEVASDLRAIFNSPDRTEAERYPQIAVKKYERQRQNLQPGFSIMYRKD